MAEKHPVLSASAVARLESLRDVSFRRRPSRRVRGETSALKFINEAGFCTAFSRHLNVPCLWVAICGERRPRMPVHTHHDYAIGLTWNLKDSLPEKRLVFYARVLRRLPTLISLEYLPLFCRLFSPAWEDPGEISLPPGAQARAKLQPGWRPVMASVSAPARGILDRLRTWPPQTTAQLRLHASYGERIIGKAAFEKVIAELQQKFLVVRTQAVYEPKFTYIWDLFERQFPTAVRTAARLTRQQALDAILCKYFDVVCYANAADIRSLFGLHPAEVCAALARLTVARRISGPVRLPRRTGSYWLSAKAASAL